MPTASGRRAPEPGAEGLRLAAPPRPTRLIGDDLERLTVHARVHAAHRLRGFRGECRFVHGVTWDGTIAVVADEFPRDACDRTLPAAALEALLLQFDHRLVTASADRAGGDVEPHDGEGVVVIEGRTPTVENVCRHVAAQVDALIRARFPGRGVRYGIEVAMREDGDGFSVSHATVI